MAKFETKKQVLTDFIDAIKCEGIISVDNEKVKSGMLFENFMLIVGESAVTCTATDTRSNKVIAQHTLLEVKVEEQGEIYVTDTMTFVSALKRCGGSEKDDIIIQYPYDGSSILVQKKGTTTGFSFPSQGKKDITSLEKVEIIPHRWDAELKVPVSYSNKKKEDIVWEHKIVALPEDLAEIALDMKDFVKQKVVNVEIDGSKIIFSMGAINSTRKGKRELANPARFVFKENKWMPAVTEEVEKIETQYYHGFYAVLQNLPQKQSLELYFQQFAPKGYMCWIRSFSSKMELHYLVPFDISK